MAVLALAAALAAALLYGAGTVLQAIGARHRRPVTYGIGLGLDGLGFASSLVALHRLPLFVVEAAIASSVAVTALLAVLVLRARLGAVERAALVAVVLGLVALAASAQEGASTPLGAPAELALLGAVVPVAVLGLLGWRRPPTEASGLVLALVAGLGFGGTGIAGRALSLGDPWWSTVTSPVLWALAAYGVVSLVAFGLALQRAATTAVAAVTFVVETLVPTAVGLIWLGDRVRGGLAWAAALGLALTLAGCLVLARYASLEDDPDLPDA